MQSTNDDDRPRLLDPVDRISEILFGLIMAVTIVGSLSIASAGKNEVRTVLYGAFGCNIAWGLVDAVMYLVRTMTERTRYFALGRKVLDADPATARRVIASTLPDHLAKIAGPDEIEGMRGRLLALPPQEPAALRRDDYLASIGIFLWVVIATFPVVLPFILTSDAAQAMNASRAITLVMLFLAGFALGRHAGYRWPITSGLLMATMGAILILAVMALGG